MRIPEARLIHIVRDPRSVYASLKSAVGSFEKTSVFPGNPMAGARFWLDDFEQGRRIQTLTKNYFELRYETLLSAGAPELQRVFDWLGLAADRAFCEQTIEAASLKNLQKMANAPKAFFRKGEAEGWREELTEEEIRILEYMLKDRMEELGYQRAYSDVRRPLKLVVEEGVQTGFNRVQTFAVKTMRKFGYVIPRTAHERKVNKERRAAREAKKARGKG